mgnify:CR=1 FL=1
MAEKAYGRDICSCLEQPSMDACSCNGSVALKSEVAILSRFSQIQQPKFIRLMVPTGLIVAVKQNTNFVSTVCTLVCTLDTRHLWIILAIQHNPLIFFTHPIDTRYHLEFYTLTEVN